MKRGNSEVISTLSGASRNSGYRRGSTFNLNFSLRHRFRFRHSCKYSKSQVSLDSDSDSSHSEMSFNIAKANTSSLSSDQLNLSSSITLQVPNQTVCYISPRRQPRLRQPSGSVGGGGGVPRECPVCLVEQDADQFPEVMTNCDHRTCRDCLQRYLQIEISESRIKVMCTECPELLHPNDVHAILEDRAVKTMYEEFMLRRVLATDPDVRWCPAPDCGYAVITADCAGCPKLKCEKPGCDTFFCYHCKQQWHPNQTCNAARTKRFPNMRSGSLSYSTESCSKRDDIKPCPCCGALFVKMNGGSCNHMSCMLCGAEFCWLCMKEITDLHYLSPSGCTFWGKKPWSRKKKILWQLGTLVGAPVGITLVASIAIPAMIIGIPVWVGRKIHARYEDKPSRHRRNLAITGGVVASIIVAPVIAGLAVGTGVPILLAYVYGVVPVSLCRSCVGCGITKNTGGVRFDFDENINSNHPCRSPYRAADRQSVDTTHNVANPSIAPSIGDTSLAMTNSLSASGSHVDQVGVLHDESGCDSTSNHAIASSSLNGSLCGSTYAAVDGYQNKLEVQADVSTSASLHVRDSCSNESANISLSERSTAVSYGDNCSTRVLAGSILSVKHQVPAGVSSNISLISRDSFSTESANARITEHLGTVSYSDDCSTRATAGSILSFEHQVPAGVPSNISLISRDSFSTESANARITEHLGSVSYSDDCSTRATAGSILSFEHQVPAGVPSNISLISRDSFSTESANARITEHLGSVSYSDDCSTRATAGSILSFEHDVQADVSTTNVSLHVRDSFSNESTNTSLSERSTAVSCGDNCNTRALAGSVLSFDFELDVPMEGDRSDTSMFERLERTTSVCMCPEKSMSLFLWCPEKEKLPDVSASCDSIKDNAKSIGPWAHGDMSVDVRRGCSTWHQQRDPDQRKLENIFLKAVDSVGVSGTSTNTAAAADGKRIHYLSRSQSRKSILSVSVNARSGRLDLLSSQERIDISSTIPEVESDRPSCSKTPSSRALSEASTIDVSCTSVHSDCTCLPESPELAKRSSDTALSSPTKTADCHRQL
ncbi:E3 ubiquitin-protein ligase RNF19A-like isoform X2 [Gigantopelta aegis]|uniref:E3 ubiquitin-protein ligase RNF19A-like isoform X2 n=1 Tax=Gigantopelta aegis TaxID=1735272 RepID=UPI001B888D98|nr:E3 ubiquitin-protein ligase RNF19A-like isoform X2 [Gigantopelta aegis]